MQKIGIGIDYSNICKDYNTMYLDRDNNDIETKKCIKKVLTWLQEFLPQLLEEFGYKAFKLNGISAEVEDIASKRFLFYSLEKAITVQAFVAQKESIKYNNVAAWSQGSDESILIQNDEEGEGIYFYVEKDSPSYNWIKTTLKDLSLDEVPLEV